MNSSIPDPDNQDIYGEMNQFFMNPYVLVAIVVLFITVIILSLGKSTSTGSGSNSYNSNSISNTLLNGSPGSSFLSQCKQ